MEFIEKILLLTDPQALGYAGVFESMIQLHITFGIISLVVGTAIMMSTKGNQRHRQVGRIFVIAMLGNFLLGVPLGSLGQLMVGQPANFMTVIGAVFVGTVTYSGYRLASAGVAANRWHDKTMLALQVLAGALYLYTAALMVTGSSLFGLTALTSASAEQFTFAHNTFPIFSIDTALIATAGGAVFAITATEHFAVPAFLAIVTFWFSLQDWVRIRGTRTLSRQTLIQQHLTRLLVIYSAAISAVLLNTSWVSLAVCWSLPPVVALLVALYYKRNFFRKQVRSMEPLEAAV